MRKKLIWSDIDSLPLWNLKEYEMEAKKSSSLILIDGFAIDVGYFKEKHPGGSDLLVKYVGKDATKAFYGILNNHTRSARQIMQDLRVARVEEIGAQKED